jgi:uncharacterized protein (TIGR03083 family)
MDNDAVWAAIDHQRRRLCDLFDELGDDEWATPSLCPGWTVKDIAVHLTFAQAGFGQVLGVLVKGGFAVNRATRVSTTRRASEMSTGDATAAIRAMIGSRRHIATGTCREVLIDILVHSLDVAIPLDRPMPLDPAASAEAADRIWRLGYTWWPRRRLRGHRLTATDADWSVGHGDVPISAPMATMLLLVTGRTTVDRLAGAAAPGPTPNG